MSAAREEGRGRRVPEACCKLAGDRLLLEPADENCIVSPTRANSYMFTVRTTVVWFLLSIIVFIYLTFIYVVYYYILYLNIY